MTFKHFAVLIVASMKSSLIRLAQRPRTVCWLLVYFCWVTLLAGCNTRRYVERAAAMEPTIKAGQRVEVDLAAYKPHAPERWDIVIFKHPENPGDDSPSMMRIVGLPGETIQMQPAGIIIDGQPLEIPPKLRTLAYGSLKLPVPSTNKTGQPPPAYPLKIPDNCYFVLGDNTPNAYDSRFWGVLPGKAILGKVLGY